MQGNPVMKYRAEGYNKIVDNLPEKYDIAVRRGYRKRPSVRYFNEAVTFDIESTSYTCGDLKAAWMYCWQFYFHGHVYMGRNWEEFEFVLRKLQEHFSDVIIPVYVHNLAFEFSFMRKIFPFTEVFCVRSLYPVRARWGNIEFRDSLILSGLPLEKLPTRTKKLKGDLDYWKVRTEVTPLTKKEIDYCINDVVVLKEYIEGKLKNDDMATIPMTRTGYVRRDVRNKMKSSIRRVRTLRLTMDEYRDFEQLFAGGFTHAAAHTSGVKLTHVRSLDITSSYPTVMVVEQYPVSNFSKVEPERYEDALKKYCCMCRVEVKNIEIREESPDCILSESKCIHLHPDAVLDNGRVVSASHAVFLATEVDLRWMKIFYSGEFYISEMYAATKGYLPSEFIKAVLFYYSEKTKFKGVKGKEDWYALMKECVNALYGMCATKPLKLPIGVDEDGNWLDATAIFAKMAGPDAEGYQDVYFKDELKKYNGSYSRFIFYPWAAWVTSYARSNLFTMMWKCGEDYHYSDTDSLKITNYLLHKKSFDRYNRRMVARIRDALKRLHIDPALAVPKDPKGVTRPLGVFTDEGEYLEFKTLGAKRYMYTEMNPETGGPEIHVTVAGAPKKQITSYMASFENPYPHFNDGLVVPPGKSGKLMATHIDTPFEGMITDYTGRSHYVYTPCGTHLAPMEVTMKISEKYAAYLALIKAEGAELWVDIGLI